MGYYTRFTIKAKIDPIDLKETQAVKDIVSFFSDRKKDVDECNVAALISKFPKHFNVREHVLIEDLEDRLEEIVGYRFDIGGESGPCKWYDYNKHMLQLSLEFPNVTFVVEGIGEDQGDIWRATYKAGTVENKKAKIVFE